MVRVASIVLLGLLPAAASAEDCPGFGLSSAYLSQLFCHQLQDVKPETTRSARPDEASSTPESFPLDDGWLDLEPVAEAWRSDPAKTLRLIERIRDAGGRPVN